MRTAPTTAAAAQPAIQPVRPWIQQATAATEPRTKRMTCVHDDVRICAVTTSSTTEADPAITRLLSIIVDELRPLQVWLFGSRAEGRARPDSDYDILVVLPDD